MESPWSGLRDTLRSRRRLRRQLGPHRAQGVVVAHVATLVLIATTDEAWRRRCLCRATSGSSRTVFTLACSQSSSSLSEVATSATARTLSKDTSPAQRARSGGAVPQAFSPTWLSARAPGAETPKRTTTQARARSPPRLDTTRADRPRPGARRISPSVAALPEGPRGRSSRSSVDRPAAVLGRGRRVAKRGRRRVSPAPSVSCEHGPSGDERSRFRAPRPDAEASRAAAMAAPVAGS